MKKFALTLLASAMLSGAAWAGQCPTMVNAIDEALATSELSDADKAAVMELRNEGEELHNAGNHAESEEKLAEAKEILGIE